jgi:hypothetical protein
MRRTGLSGKAALTGETAVVASNTPMPIAARTFVKENINAFAVISSHRFLLPARRSGQFFSGAPFVISCASGGVRYSLRQ